ncbi:hypothetical protein EGU64_27410 [Achromobacter denitrificans]|nr:hypothetical protein EGU64_27410 [Achromobacter denitrificans]
MSQPYCATAASSWSLGRSRPRPTRVWATPPPQPDGAPRTPRIGRPAPRGPAPGRPRTPN